MNCVALERPGAVLNGTPDREEDLLRSARAGDSEAFGKLMRIHQPTLFGMILRQLNQLQDAEDVLQDVFIQAFQHLSGFRGESKLSTWLYTIALNRVRNYLRQRRVRRQVSLDAPGLENDGDSTPQWADGAPSPEKTVEKRSELQTIQNALNLLSREQRSIFILHYFQNLSLEDVARRIRRPLGTVKVYLHRSRKALYKRLDLPPRRANGPPCVGDVYKL